MSEDKLLEILCFDSRIPSIDIDEWPDKEYEELLAKMEKDGNIVDNDALAEQKKADWEKLVELSSKYDDEDELKEVRNSNEAHKFKDFEVQLESIENLSAARSIELIQEFNMYLANLTMVFMIPSGALSRKLGEIVNKKIEKRNALK